MANGDALPSAACQSSAGAPVPRFTVSETPLTLPVTIEPTVSEPESPVAWTPSHERGSGATGVSDAMWIEPPVSEMPTVAVPIARCSAVSSMSSSDAPVSTGAVESTAVRLTEKCAEPETTPARSSESSEPEAASVSTVRSMPATWSAGSPKLPSSFRSSAVVQSSAIAGGSPCAASA